MLLFFCYRTFWFHESWATQVLNLRTGPIYCYHNQEFWIIVPVVTTQEGSFLLFPGMVFPCWSFVTTIMQQPFEYWEERCTRCAYQTFLETLASLMDKSELVVMFIRGTGECEYKTFGLLCLLICKITVILHTWEMTEAIYPFLRNNAGELQVKQSLPKASSIFEHRE